MPLPLIHSENKRKYGHTWILFDNNIILSLKALDVRSAYVSINKISHTNDLGFAKMI